MSVVFLHYFASLNLFIHCHKLPNRIIVHSHPFPNKPHNHSDNAIETIDLLSQVTCVGTQQIEAPQREATLLETIADSYADSQITIEALAQKRLRAPPSV